MPPNKDEINPMKIDETKKNQVFVIEESGQTAHLGGCGNPNQAVHLVNAALKAGKVKNPRFTLVVPTNKVMPCVPETTVRLVPAVKSPTTPPAERPSAAQAG
jgi:hypothetical protein